jgi:hypothetical protein
LEEQRRRKLARITITANTRERQEVKARLESIIELEEVGQGGLAVKIEKCIPEQFVQAKDLLSPFYLVCSYSECAHLRQDPLA